MQIDNINCQISQGLKYLNDKMANSNYGDLKSSASNFLEDKIHLNKRFVSSTTYEVRLSVMDLFGNVLLRMGENRRDECPRLRSVDVWEIG